jgi:hypothetical protein
MCGYARHHARSLYHEEPEALQTIAEEHGYVDGHNPSSVDDDGLPRRAQYSAFPVGNLPRTHALLVPLLPASLVVPRAYLAELGGSIEGIIVSSTVLHRL